MSDSIPVMFREIQRLRRHLRDVKKEIDFLPVSLKAYRNKTAKQEQALKDAQDGIKKMKVVINDKEVSLKAANQLLAKYEKQANDTTTTKEVTAIQTEIDNTKKHIAELEEEVLVKLAELDEKNAALPGFNEQLQKAREQLAAFETEMVEIRERLLGEIKLAETELKQVEARIPPIIRGAYDRLVKSHGSEGFAAVTRRSCGQCNQSVSAEQVSELTMGRFVCCSNCGKAMYLVE
jgi:predicted  nucleic acid-binding Zn-ribbon protein